MQRPKARSNVEQTPRSQQMMPEAQRDAQVAVRHADVMRDLQNLSSRTQLQPPIPQINPTNFGQLDFLLLHQDWLACISQLYSRMDMPLVSHHFPVIAELTLDIPHASSQQRSSAFNSASLLNEPSLQNQCACLVHESMVECLGDVTAPHTADTLCSQLTRSLHVAADKCLPRRLQGCEA